MRVTDRLVNDVYLSPGVPREVITFRARTRKARPDGTRETRQISLHKDLISYLANYEHPESGWLFPGRADHKHITYDSVYQYWQEKFLELGLDNRGFSCHSTRRWFITELVRSGTHPKVIQKITGHKNLNIVMDYAEVSDETIKNALSKMPYVWLRFILMSGLLMFKDVLGFCTTTTTM